MGASWPVRSRMAAVCALLLLAPVAGKPVVINLGPLMDDQLLMEDLSSALEAKHWPALIEGQQEDLLQGLLQDFGKGLLGGPAAGGFGPGSSVNFQTEVKDGHFRLRASLPGYSMHRSSDGEEPLDVQVAGRTLVVQGSKSNGNMMTSFQRSFRLPWDPDKDHVSVTYSAQDGSLLVDVPRGASSSASDAADSDSGAAAALPGEFLEPLSILAGPQMTLSFSDMDAKLAPRRRPLRGLPIVMGLRPTVRDPFEQLWNGLLADASGMHDVAVPEADPDRKHSMHSKSQPVVVQPKKSAAPFWRFTTGPESRARYLDIVSPQGVEMGKIRGSYVEFFNKGEGQESPKRLELPISVREEDCRQTHMGSQEHVLRCATKDSVKSLHIDVIDEL